MLIAEFAIVGGDEAAIVWFGAGLHLINEVADGQSMVLGGAEDQSFFPLVDLVHEELDAVGFALLDLDDLVEVVFGVALAAFDLALDDLIVRRVDVFIEGGGNLLYAERSEIAV